MTLIGKGKLYNCKNLYNDFCKIDNTLTYKQFREIIYNFNKKIIDEIIENNKVFNLGYKLGNLSVYQYDRKIKKGKHNNNFYTSINHFLSEKNKKEIIKNGDTPLKMIKDNGKIIGDNGGKPWLVYNFQDIVSLTWKKYKCIDKENSNEEEKNYIYPLKHIKRYSLKFTKDNILRLARNKRENNKDYSIKWYTDTSQVRL
jgi:hypothetical protein